jgi:hypothetical protein
MCQLNHIARTVPWEELQASLKMAELFKVLERAIANITGGRDMELCNNTINEEEFRDDVDLRSKICMYLPTCLGGMGFSDKDMLAAPFLAASMESYAHTVKFLNGVVPEERIRETLSKLVTKTLKAYNETAFREEVSIAKLRAFVGKHANLSKAPARPLTAQHMFSGHLSAIPVVGNNVVNSSVKIKFQSTRIQGALQARIKALVEIDIQNSEYKYAADIGSKKSISAKKLTIMLSNLSNDTARIFTAIPRAKKGTFFNNSEDYALALQHYMDICPLQLWGADPKRCATKHRDTSQTYKRYHSITGCTNTGLNTVRHDKMCETIAAKARALNLHGIIECNPSINYRDAHHRLQRPADIVIDKPHGLQKRLLIDLTVVDDDQFLFSSNNQYVGNPIRSLEEAYKEKAAKYSDVVSREGVELWPIVFSERGHVYSTSRAALQSLFGNVQPRFGVNKSILFHELIDNLVFDVLRGDVAQIRKHISEEQSFLPRPGQ